jgi:hypothetical protein
MKASNGSIELTKPEIRALIEFASKDEIRPIHNVQFSPATGTVAATDGHTCLLLSADEPTHGESYLMARTDLQTVYKTLRPKDTAVVLRYNDDVLVNILPQNTLCTPFKVREGNYPDLQFLYIDNGEGRHPQSVGVDPKYLARLLLVQKAVGAPGMEMITPRGDGLFPLRFKARKSDTSADVLILPMRL